MIYLLIIILAVALLWVLIWLLVQVGKLTHEVLVLATEKHHLEEKEVLMIRQVAADERTKRGLFEKITMLRGEIVKHKTAQKVRDAEIRTSLKGLKGKGYRNKTGPLERTKSWRKLMEKSC